MSECVDMCELCQNAHMPSSTKYVFGLGVMRLDLLSVSVGLTAGSSSTFLASTQNESTPLDPEFSIEAALPPVATLVPDNETLSSQDIAATWHTKDIEGPGPSGGTDEEHSSDDNGALFECLDSYGLRYVGHTDGEFEEKISVWNLIYESRPTVYVTPFTSRQVSQTVLCAVSANRTVTARSGGHSYAGWGRGEDNGVVVDLKHMNEVVVDKFDQVWVGAGVRMGRLYAELWRQGKRAVPGGTCPQPGAIPLTLGGGQGIASRKHGLMVDNVMEFEVVLSNGEIVTVDHQNYPDLFWALRGSGGGNFGIVTRMKMLTFKPPELVSARQFLVLPPATGTFINEIFRFAKNASDEFGGYFAVTSLAVKGYLTYLGPLRELDFRASDFLRVMGEAVLPVGVETDWANLYQIVSNDTYFSASLEELDFPPTFSQMPVYSRIKSLIVNEDDFLPPVVLDSVQLALSTSNPEITLVNVELLGGAINRVPSESTAFGHRNTALIFEPCLSSKSPISADEERWLNRLYNILKPYVSGGSYVNFVDPDLRNAGHNYYGDNFEDLKLLAGLWDPNSTFASPHSLNRIIDEL
eukprot:Gregarina_sp_Poly_1__2112@NODE_155_length_12405_cov_134_674339_g137_i0_p3_GENE_NODE_155_length_12405_cov_134_674339_g137_i0NODE_155_length_12405_cov_134_674339_g137_i0_p3_ORF_typecomplete_len581_score80_01FAD_binding_4/PF01565_23/7_1e31BBE/PF08031_12/1_2e08_NODE_155_length_12405_cov_134_674339_g137_i04472189